MTVTITVNAVNDAPVANDDAYSTNEDTLLTVAVADGVINNDEDADGDSLLIVTVHDPTLGLLTMYPDGSFTYIPDERRSWR